MIYLLRLIRLPNLLIIVLTMVLVRYAILAPIFAIYGIGLELPVLLFALLVLAVVLVAAAGYMINDYFDVQTDLVNRPDKVIVDKKINSKTVYSFYFVVNAIALGLSLFVSFKAGSFNLFTIFPLTIGALWFYSTTYKNQLLVGNIIVSLITAVVPLLVPLYETPLIYSKYHSFTEAYGLLMKLIYAWCGIYALFAFLMTFIRELVKDAEDFEGDASIGRNTMPVVYGLTITKSVIVVIVALIVFLLGFIFFRYLSITCSDRFDILSLTYLFLCVYAPLFVVVFLLYTAKSKRNYTIAASLIKLVIVAGLCYTLIGRYMLTKCI